MPFKQIQNTALQQFSFYETNKFGIPLSRKFHKSHTISHVSTVYVFLLSFVTQLSFESPSKISTFSRKIQFLFKSTESFLRMKFSVYSALMCMNVYMCMICMMCVCVCAKRPMERNRKKEENKITKTLVSSIVF